MEDIIVKRLFCTTMLIVAISTAICAQNKYVNRDMKKNQMHLILKGNDIRSYNTDNISAIDFSDNGSVNVDGDIYSGNVGELSFSKALEDSKSGLFTNSADKVETLLILLTLWAVWLRELLSVIYYPISYFPQKNSVTY